MGKGNEKECCADNRGQRDAELLTPPLRGCSTCDHEEEEPHVGEPGWHVRDRLHERINKEIHDSAHEGTCEDDSCIFRARCCSCDDEAEDHARNHAPRAQLVALHVDFAVGCGEQVVCGVSADNGHVHESACRDENLQEAVAKEHAEHAAGAENNCDSELRGGRQMYAREELRLDGIQDIGRI